MHEDLVWIVERPDLAGAERCVLAATDGGWQLSGSVVASFDRRPIDVRYRITVDDGWRTRTVAVTMDDLTAARRLELRSTRGRWSVDGDPAPHLDGCIDVDLGVTPSTNTLPIRRLGLGVGEEREVEVAWVRFPELRVDRGVQRYTRLSEDTWRYRSGGFTADVLVDGNGLVVRYGEDLWRRVADRP